MSGPVSQRHKPRGFGRGAALTLVFAGVLATASATDSLPRTGEPQHRVDARDTASTIEGDQVADAAAWAIAHGKSGTDAAEQVVSRSGDRWGAVYGKGEYEEFEQALDGEYTGVGLGARRTADGFVEVTRVQRGGPARRAGMRPGDIVRQIDGTSIAGRPITQVMAMLRGDSAGGEHSEGVGSTVTLGVQRGGHRWTATMRRARLAVDSVTVGTVRAGALHIRVDSFTKGSGDEVRDAVLSAPAGVGILLDLRGNAGGLVSEAVTAASAFLDGGLVATYDIKGRQHALYAQRGGDTARRVVVLVDGGTMSAAELVTGALQDRGRAVTVGSRTFGKGSIQMPSTLPDGSVAELTVGHYRTPSGRVVDGHGITPDLVAGDDAERRAETVLSGLGGGA